MAFDSFDFASALEFLDYAGHFDSFDFGGAATSAPVVTLFSAPLGRPNTPFVIDATDVEGFRKIIITAKFTKQRVHEVVYDGDFGFNYSPENNRRDNITGGYRFTILRNGGWPIGESAEIRFHAFDIEGHET